MVIVLRFGDLAYNVFDLFSQMAYFVTISNYGNNPDLHCSSGVKTYKIKLIR